MGAEPVALDRIPGAAARRRPGRVRRPLPAGNTAWATGPGPGWSGTARVAAGAAAVAWLAALPITATYLVGDAGGLGRGSTWSALPATEYAVAGSVVVGVLAAVVLLGSGSPTRPRAIAATAAAAVAVCAPSFTGHTRAAAPEALAVAADALHLVVGSVWLGGLVALALVLPDLAARGTVGAEVLARFSGVAAGLLAVLVGTGALLTWRIVGSWAALVDTGYGRLLLVKGGIAAVAMGVAAWNRFSLLPRLRDATKRRDRRSGAGLVARATAAEAGVLVAVLLVTGLLVDRSPEQAAPVAAGDPSQSVARTAALGEIDVRATLATQVVGPNTVTLELLDDQGEPTEGFEAPRPSLSGDDVDLGAVEVVSVAPGTYEAEVVIPSPGSWELQVSLRTSEFDNPVAKMDFTVSGG